MDHGQLSMVADKFQWVFSEPLLNACGKDVKFCRRQRVITPFRLGLALTAICASQRVETIADFHCSFNALFGTTVTYKAFYNQVAKPHFAAFARTMAERLISDMTLKVLGFEKGRAFGEFRHIVLQDHQDQPEHRDQQGRPDQQDRSPAVMLDPSWVREDTLRLRRELEFGNFRDAFGFVARLALLAEAEGHHPDIELGWGRVAVTLTTHAAGGLTDNDFILAARLDRL